jgi:predicted GNAT family N-acyltransferase
VSEYLSVPLDHSHQTADFDSGQVALDRWLRDHGLRAQLQETARTHVWTTSESSAVLAYHSVAPTEIGKDEVPRSMSGGVSRVPAYLIARLALDRTLHGQRLGAELLFDALGAIVRAATSASARLIAVDAIDDKAASFYRHHHIQPVNDRRLVMKVATARKMLGE